MSDPVDRFRRRRRQLQGQRPGLQVVPEESAVQALLDASPGEVHTLPPVVGEAPEVLLARVRQQQRVEVVDRLAEDCGRAILSALVRPFGLAGLLFRGLDASRQTELLQQRENADLNYHERPYHDGSREYRAARRDLHRQADEGTLHDIYAPDRNLSERVNGRRQYDTEHVIASKAVHDKAHGRVLSRLATSETERAAIANQSENLGATDQSLNRSKGEHALLEWMDAPSRQDPSRTNAEFHGMDREASEAAYARASAAIERELRMAELQFVTKNTWHAVSSGVRMGIQQALGLVLIEVVAGVWTEVRRLWRLGEMPVVTDLSEAVRAVAKRVASRREAVWTAFKVGTLGGFLGSVAAIVVNQLVRGVRNLARLVREGATSVVEAGRLMANASGDRSAGVHAASKVLVTGAGVLLGVAVEEALVATLHGSAVGLALGPAVQPLAMVLGALTAGLVGAVGSHYIEQADVLEVRAEAEHDRVMAELDRLLVGSTPAPC